MSHSYRIQVDLDKCVGSRICVAIAPKVFLLNEDGQASVVDTPGDTVENIRMAAEGCPVSAITVEEMDSEFFTPSEHDPAIAAVRASEQGHVDAGLGAAFQVKIASTGQVFDVPSDKTILQVLRTHGIEVETACELGVCGTCRTHYLEGEPDHRDFVLEAQEQEKEMTVCCSRSKSPMLVLDL